MTKILENKEKETRHEYRGAAPMREILSHVPARYRNVAKKIIPSRIKRFLDERMLR
jgi:hypothetical protein